MVNYHSVVRGYVVVYLNDEVRLVVVYVVQQDGDDTDYHGDDMIDLWHALNDVGESDKSGCNERIIRAITFSMERVEKYK